MVPALIIALLVALAVGLVLGCRQHTDPRHEFLIDLCNSALAHESGEDERQDAGRTSRGPLMA